ncbi:hypothetical protein F7725_025658 [Dissostichus mawsoni]|uniref:Peroxisomal biogenesis factor 11 beta n=1 Tax=Dissostichus mawsoni TaxID=36200 RepID=A0A7J5XBS7_DISMA|nr:hypothetical protein F7725_025658 [Dissostichus mawsoni]
MESWVRFNSQSQAKERIIRAAQYACTLLGYTLQKGGAAADLLHTVSQLEAHMSLSRKLLRLGNSVEALEAAKRAIHLSDGVLRLCLTISHLNRAMYFACDNILWAGKTGLVPEWTCTSGARDLSDVYELHLLMDREAHYRASKSPPSVQPSPSLSADPPSPAPEALPWLSRQLHLLVTVLYTNPPLLLDLLKNLCDIFIPLDRLGIRPTGSGFVGACGLTSSLLSIATILHPWLKLKP